MASHRATLLMAVLLAGLGAYLYFVELPSERARVQTTSQARKLLPFTEQDITSLTVSTGTAPDIVLALNEQRAWTITAPLRTDADRREIGEMLRALALGTVTRVVEEQAAALEPYGLAHPAVTFTLVAGDRSETLALGDVGPLSSTLYALRGSEKQVLLTDLPPKLLLGKTLTGLRRKDVLPVREGQIERLRLSTPKTEIMLERLDDKQKRKWQVRFPVDVRADQPAMRNLLINLENLKALAFVDPGPERDKLARALGTPLVKLTATVGATDHVLKLYQPTPSSGEAYAVTAPDAPIYKVAPSAIQDFTRDLFALQDKRLLGVDAEEVFTLVIKTRADQFILNRHGGEWTMNGMEDRALDQQITGLLVSRIIDLPAELRVVKEAGPLAPYGLVSPSAEFIAMDKDGKTRGKLVLGSKAGGLVYAMGSGLTGIYQARADILNQIPGKDSLFAKPAAPAAGP